MNAQPKSPWQTLAEEICVEPYRIVDELEREAKWFDERDDVLFEEDGD